MTTTQSTNWHTFHDRIDPHALISIIPIHRSQKISVVGAHSGGLAIPIAKYVYDGALVALNSDSKILDELMSEASRVHLTNISGTQFDKSDLSGSGSASDGVVMSEVLHTTTSPMALFTQSVNLLQPGGWMLIVDWLPTEEELDDDGPARSRRVAPDKLMRWATDCDLIPITKRVLGRSRYVHVYRKRG